MNNLNDQLVTIFCEIDDYCKLLRNHPQAREWMPTGRRGPAYGLTLSDLMTVVIMAQFVRYRDFKTYYIQHVQVY